MPIKVAKFSNGLRFGGPEIRIASWICPKVFVSNPDFQLLYVDSPVWKKNSVPTMSFRVEDRCSGRKMKADDAPMSAMSSNLASRYEARCVCIGVEVTQRRKSKGEAKVCVLRGLTLPITGLRQAAKRAVAIPVDWRVRPHFRDAITTMAG